MARAVSNIDTRSRFNLLLFVLFLALLFLFGGASRADVLSQPVVRFAAILIIAVSAGQFQREDWRMARPLLLFIGALAAVMLVQLVPLPPALWESLPGRSLYAQALAGAGLAPAWRPISMTPDLTLNSLLALLPALAAVFGLNATARSSHSILLPALLTCITVSAVIGMLQIASGAPYFYQITNAGSAVGVFANRNHQAVLLACAFPILACWSAMPHRDPAYARLRFWLALCGAAALFPLLMISGSRAGLALGLLGALVSLPLSIQGRALFHGRALRGWARLAPALPILIGVAAIAGSLIFARDVALRRLIAGTDFELRTELLPTFVKMAGDYFPFGSGFGSFDPIFRGYEPDGALGFTYLNHAHNDFVQIVIEGGILSLLLVLLFGGWFLVHCWRLWRTRMASPADLLGRTGSAVVLLLLLASVVDYPLRTPLLSVLMVIGCFWMRRHAEPRPAREDQESADRERVGSAVSIG